MTTLVCSCSATVMYQLQLYILVGARCGALVFNGGSSQDQPIGVCGGSSPRSHHGSYAPGAITKGLRVSGVGSCTGGGGGGGRPPCDCDKTLLLKRPCGWLPLVYSTAKGHRCLHAGVEGTFALHAVLH